MLSGSQDEVDVFREQLEELGADDLVFPGVEDGSEKLHKTFMKLGLTTPETRDLIEYLKSL